MESNSAEFCIYSKTCYFYSSELRAAATIGQCIKQMKMQKLAVLQKQLLMWDY